MSSETTTTPVFRHPKKRSRNSCLEEYTQAVRGPSLISCTSNNFNIINIHLDNKSDQQAIEVVEEEIVSADDTILTEWKILSQQYTVSYKGSRVPTPIKTFSECSLSPDLLTALFDQDYGRTTPSPIDMVTIPLALEQRDVLCSGLTDFAPKARVFLMPLLMRVLRLPRMPPRRRDTKGGGGPYAVILASDRNLVEALQSLISRFYPILRISVYDLCGPKADIIEGIPVIVATPFRLYDCIVRRLVTLNQCSFIALYQVDQILEAAGRIFYLDYIMKALPTHYLKPEKDEDFIDGEVYRTTYVLASTITPPVKRLADEFLRSPVEMNLGQVLP